VAFGPTAAVLIDHSGKYKIKIVFIVFKMSVDLEFRFRY
jgi:hypothetical protein